VWILRRILRRQRIHPWILNGVVTKESGKESLSAPSVFFDSLTFPTKVPSDSLGWIGSLKRTSDKSLFPMALGSCGHRITH